MADVPGLAADVFFGDTQVPLPDWRAEADDDNDDDDVSPERMAYVWAALGFDPSEVDQTQGQPGDAPKVPPSPFRKG